MKDFFRGVYSVLMLPFIMVGYYAGVLYATVKYGFVRGQIEATEEIYNNGFKK